MKKTLTQVTVDCLLAFFLNSAEQADKVLLANLSKVSVKNKRVLQQVLERNQANRASYWLAIADELARMAHEDDKNVETLKPTPIAATARLCVPLVA